MHLENEQHIISSKVKATPKFDRLLRAYDLVGRPAKGDRPAVDGVIKGSRAWLLAMTKAGKFPQPIRIGQRFTVWRESEVMAWIATRQAKPVEA